MNNRSGPKQAHVMQNVFFFSVFEAIWVASANGECRKKLAKTLGFLKIKSNVLGQIFDAKPSKKKKGLQIQPGRVTRGHEARMILL